MPTKLGAFLRLTFDDLLDHLSWNDCPTASVSSESRKLTLILHWEEQLGMQT